MGAVLAAVSMPATADYRQFATTASFLGAPEEVREAYVAGIADALVAHRVAPPWMEACLTQLTVREMRAAFERWLRRNPDEHVFALPTTFAVALDDYCSNPVPW